MNRFFFIRAWRAMKRDVMFSEIQFSSFRIAVVIHMFHDELAEEFLWYLKNMPHPFELYISTHSRAAMKLDILFSAVFGAHHVHVRVVENRGRDMAPFIVEFNTVYQQYDLICWVHSKKSEHNSALFSWRTYLLDNLLGSKSIIYTIISYFMQDPRIGVIYPDYFPPIKDWVAWGNNYTNAVMLLEKMGIALNENEKLEFPAGGMFWFRPAALTPLFTTGLELSDFEDKAEQMLDGTLAHAIERIILFVAKSQNYVGKKILFKKFVN